MRRWVLLAGLALGALAPSGAVVASGDYGCEISWKLASDHLTCADSAMLSPGNDTRVNLLFLLRDRAGLSAAAYSYPEPDSYAFGFGRTFFDWGTLRQTYYPRPQPAAEPDYGEFDGLRCNTATASTPAFLAALDASRKLPAAEREKLTAARGYLADTCRNAGPRGWPEGISSKPGQDFLAYLKAADAFYRDDWGAARQGFEALRRSREPWVAETAAYMVARSELAAAQASAFDEWGWFEGGDKIDREALARAQSALAVYLAKWPKGAYADSARGLVRRGLWFAGDLKNLAKHYEALLGSVAAGEDAGPRLVEEIDNKLLFARGVEGTVDGPLLLATLDLLMMRSEAQEEESEEPGPAPRVLTLEQLEAQQPVFAGRADLFDFLRANHAYYVAGDMRRVLALIPDEARRESYTTLAFSRQVLRGMALAALKDGNEAGFWRDLLRGATGAYQRSAVELALAMSYERSGRLAEVFAKDSPIGDEALRTILLQHSAGPELLRAQVKRTDRGARERAIALLALLYKQLTRGDYAGFARDVALVPKDADVDGGLWDLQRQSDIPVGLFASGTWSDGYPCPALNVTAAALARNPRDVKARLCLGDFYRLNGFDRFDAIGERPPEDELGGAADLFPGKPTPRIRFYTDIAADPSASAENRAYALYRAVKCYAPSGNNSCGGEDVALAQRKAWFERLKRDHAGSRWAKALHYYW